MDYYNFKVEVDSAKIEALMGLFSSLPFDTFVENESGFEAFLPANSFNSSISEEIDNLKDYIEFEYEKSFIKGENWNEVWESNFQPVLVDDFCVIRADFHPPFEGFEHELVINPKMAFGTGHHETTFSVIRIMKDLDFEGAKVFDYGCGTGVLAILASKLGAKEILAIDIEKESYLNTLENCENNSVKNVDAFQGTLENVKDRGYGIVLANINRNVILNSLASLAKMILPKGTLVLSGIMVKDQDLLVTSIEKHGFQIQQIIENGNWLAIKCVLS